MNNTYCPYAWVGVMVSPEHLAPCCNFLGGISISDVSSVNEVLHSPLFEDIRTKMLNGEKVKGCGNCYNSEEIEETSPRQYAINEYGTPTEIKTKHLDINFDNLCNLKCRMCQSASSHLLYEEEQEVYGKNIATKKYNTVNFDLDTNSLTSVQVSGGEPLISPGFKEFCKNVNTKDLELVVNTNGTAIPDFEIEETFKNCKSLSINVSIDGIWELNDFLRKKSNFKEILNVLDYFQKLKKRRTSKTELNIHTVVSLYNVNYIKEIRDFFQKNYAQYNYSYRILYWPQQMSIKHASQEYKDILLEEIYKHNDSFFDPIIQELTNKSEDFFNYFIHYNNKVNFIRNESLELVNKKLHDYIKNYKNNSILNTDTFFQTQIDIVKGDIFE